MCSEVKHGGSDTVIHTAHIKTHLSLKRIICRGLWEHRRMVQCHWANPPWSIIDINNKRIKHRKKDNKGDVFVVGRKNIQNKILLKLPVVPPHCPLYLSIIAQRLSLPSDRGQYEIQVVLPQIYSTAHILIHQEVTMPTHPTTDPVDGNGTL